MFAKLDEGVKDVCVFISRKYKRLHDAIVLLGQSNRNCEAKVSASPTKFY